MEQVNHGAPPARGRTLPVIFGLMGEHWNHGLSRSRIMTYLSRHMPVILLEPGGDGRGEPYLEEFAPNKLVLRNAMRLRQSRVGRRVARLAAWHDGRQLHRALRRGGFDDYIYWLMSNDPRMVHAMRLERMVYDCIDPCFLPEAQARFDRNEAYIARRARLVFATARTLRDKMQAHNSRTRLLPNGSDVDTWRACQSPATPLPEILSGRPRPYIGYMGTVDWRFDAQTVAEAARRKPAYTFVIVGRVNHDQESRLTELRRLPNVVMAGAASYDQGLAHTKAFDVGMIPFIPGEMNDAINPVKMYMYLLAGKPVVTTWVAECAAQPLVRAARSGAEFAQALEEELARDSAEARARRTAFGLENTWEVRAHQAMAWMREAGVMPAPAPQEIVSRTAQP